MRRRDFLWLMGAAVSACSRSALAQQSGRTFRIGVFSSSGHHPIMGPAYRAFLEALAQFGFKEGQNLTVILQEPTAQGEAVQIAKAKEFVDLKVDLIASLGTEMPLKAAAAATRTIPIVFVANNFDPITLGYVNSLAKPGGNITGIFLRQTELAEKQVELLVEAIPSRKRLAILWDGLSADQFTSANVRATLLGLQVQSLKMEKPPYDLDAAFRASAGAGSEMLLALTSPYFGQQSAKLIELTIRHRLPSMFIFKAYTLGGGLMSYGADNVAMYRQSARLVGKILQGAKPTDLPVELPTTFDFAINLKTAKAIGIELPTSILLRASEVIE